MSYLEAYVGEYASGKSENAINRALSLLEPGQTVTLVDLDLVEPFYTLRPLKKELEEKGLQVVAWDNKETMGLGEAGAVLKPEMRWVLKREGHVILDVGYGVSGSAILNMLEGISESELKILAVINIARPMTSTLQDIIVYLETFAHLDGLINNTHLGDDTDLEIIRNGVDIVSEVSEATGIPVVATAADERFRESLGEKDHRGHEIRYLKRYMHRYIW